ncbi:related to VPS72-component of the SWR1 complex, required for vacuolar protein sorting [Ustilago bromivora]|uniref:Related to VPS72 - component of the SWR1 complex, required for vacuolar protein sorting n=1 Tax=Ustilago bromivora TaxID=307758 RepID=A0A1K0GDL9_9BASI|nr:related to VPS72-component of the SWR1 complex, required for vacuolar protein sorting [Ustilago bromivora]SYW80393.1 related to VPS72 - component of the SWR1 complex, required for vacuolar protein sorting [Ustilago bromivora]
MSRPSRRSTSPSDPSHSTSYRIERFDSTSIPASDLMVTSRSKRSTAGNRLKQLLDQELERDEIFTEVENDIDFEANENEDGVDIVDSDFDRDSDDDARAAVEDESEGEREIEAQEKVDKSKRRAAVRAAGGIIKRPAAAAAAIRKPPAPPGAGEGGREAKRRRISFAPDTPSPSTSSSVLEVGSRRRTSARSATVQSKLQVESRLEEAEQRRAAQPVKVVQKKKASLTQDALIAEALEVEEENRESLRRFLEQEEERRAKQRQGKERIEGPFVRWVSAGMRVRVVQEEGKKEGENQVNAASTDPNAGLQRKDAVQDGKADRGEEMASGARLQSQQGSAEVKQAVAGDSDATMQEPGKEVASEQASASTSAPQNETPTDATCVPQPASTSSLTLDPVLAVRKEAASIRSSTGSKPILCNPTLNAPRRELQARTLLTLERRPREFSWLDEYASIFGSHVDWSCYPYVPSRNRPVKPRQSICPITGLPAIYKDPRTGIPYANALAYKVITRVLEGGFVWSGGHYSSPDGEGREGGGRGKRREKDGGKGGLVGRGAAPPQMGIWLDDEAEKGPGEVWLSAREVTPTKKPVQTSREREKESVEERRGKGGKAKQTEKATSKETRKPGFDVVVTNAVAPGDEKALLAEALSLPPGSTRSGRRVARPA